LTETEVPRWKKGVHQLSDDLSKFTWFGGLIFIVINLYDLIKRYLWELNPKEAPTVLFNIFGRTSNEVPVDLIMWAIGFGLIFAGMGFEWLAERIVPHPQEE
jgi:hypothetical protein